MHLRTSTPRSSGVAALVVAIGSHAGAALRVGRATQQFVIDIGE